MTSPWSNQRVDLIILQEAVTGFSGLFGYSPQIGAGNLVFSIAAAAGTDPYGNSYPAGLSTTSGSSTISGTDYVINNAGAFWYSGTPALGNLIIALANAAGTDAHGNAYAEGLTVAAGAVAGTTISAGTIPQAALNGSITARTLGGITTTISSTAPPAPTVSDIWIDSANGNQLLQWSGSAWTPIAWTATDVITAGTITASLITAGTITASLLAAGIIVAGIVDGTTITGATIVADGSSGEILVYSGTPAHGNLVASVSASGGTDGHSNAFQAGFYCVQAGTADWAQLSSAALVFSSLSGRTATVEGDGTGGELNLNSGTAGPAASTSADLVLYSADASAQGTAQVAIATGTAAPATNTTALLEVQGELFSTSALFGAAADPQVSVVGNSTEMAVEFPLNTATAYADPGAITAGEQTGTNGKFGELAIQSAVRTAHADNVVESFNSSDSVSSASWRVTYVDTSSVSHIGCFVDSTGFNATRVTSTGGTQASPSLITTDSLHSLGALGVTNLTIAVSTYTLLPDGGVFISIKGAAGGAVSAQSKAFATAITAALRPSTVTVLAGGTNTGSLALASIGTGGVVTLTVPAMSSGNEICIQGRFDLQ